METSKTSARPWYQRPIVQRSLAAAAICTAFYMPLHFFAVGSTIIWGVVQAAAFVPGGEFAVIAGFYALPFASLVIGAILAAFLMLLRFPRPFITGITGASLASLMIFISMLPLPVPVLYALTLVAVLGIFFVIAWGVQRISRYVIVLVVMLVSVGVSGYLLPHFGITSETMGAGVSQEETESDTKAYDQTKSQLTFTPYYPAYVPAKSTITQPELHGYLFPESSNVTVQFKIDNIKVVQSAPLGGQDKMLNFKDNCDIGGVYFEMEWHASLDETTIAESRDNLRKCHKLATTANGRDVYIDHTDNSQWTFIYASIDNTNVVFEFDDINAEKFTPSWQANIITVIESMHPYDKSKLKRGES